MKIAILMIAISISMNMTSAQNIKDCSLCSEKKLDFKDIDTLSVDDLRLLKNEIFARNGYVFESNRFSNFFQSKPWYKPMNDNTKVSLNAIEDYNVKLLKERQQEVEADRQNLKKQLHEFKKAVLSNNTNALKEKFNFEYNDNKEYNEKEYLLTILNSIDFNNMNYYRNTAYYAIDVDDGFLVTHKSVSVFPDNTIWLTYAKSKHSEIIPDFNEYTDYCSECIEFGIWWQFKFHNGKLQFIKLDIAG